MTSIRFYLVAAIIASITLLNFISALHGYRSSMTVAQRLADNQLIDMAQMLATARKPQIDRHLSDANKNMTVFQIWRDDKVLQARSSSAPVNPIAPFEAGYRDLNFNGYRWHIYVHDDDSRKEWIMIAERSDIRSKLSEQVILESILPAVAALPLVALLIWIIVGFGLKPISKLARQLRSKASDDLKPIPIDASVEELNSLIESTNDLLQRLEASFLREKSFAADAAHELRTPISALKVHLYNLQEERPEQVNELQPFKQSIERLERLVEQILGLYRSTPEQYIAKFKAIELFTLAQETIVADYDQFNNKKQQIELLGTPCIVYGDAFSLQTLLQNLLNNAGKYSPPESTIIVTVSTIETGIMLCVEDSGPGIAEDEYDKVIERFYRGQNEELHESRLMGCGLGLAIVNHIAKLHGASIKLGRSRFSSGLSVTLNFTKVPEPKTKAKTLYITASERRL